MSDEPLSRVKDHQLTVVRRVLRDIEIFSSSSFLSKTSNTREFKLPFHRQITFELIEPNLYQFEFQSLPVNISNVFIESLICEKAAMRQIFNDQDEEKSLSFR